MTQEAFQLELRYFASVRKNEGFRGFVDPHGLVKHLQQRQVPHPLTKISKFRYNSPHPLYDSIFIFYGIPKFIPDTTTTTGFIHLIDQVDNHFLRIYPITDFCFNIILQNLKPKHITTNWQTHGF